MCHSVVMRNGIIKISDIFGDKLLHNIKRFRPSDVPKYEYVGCEPMDFVCRVIACYNHIRDDIEVVIVWVQVNH